MLIFTKKGNSQFNRIATLKSERFGGLFSHPVRFIRWTGCLNYRPVSYRQFKPVPYYEPALFTAPKPQCAVASACWTPSKSVSTIMSHMLVVEGGLATCYGYIFDMRGKLIDGATHKHREGRKYPEWITRGYHIRPHSLFPAISYFQENVAVLTASTQSFYFHWLFDVLPRINMLSNFKEKADFIFIQNKYRFQKETLKLLGTSRNRIISTEDVAVLSAKKLLMPCHHIMQGREYPSWVIKYLRNQFQSGLSKTRSTNPRIYIVRRLAHCRRLTNEPEIIDKLKNYGFSAVELERLPFQEQVQLFRNARAIVAPHGSGLANLVFCSPGIPVIELFPAANVDLYYRLSMALKLKYFYVKSRIGSNTKWTLENYPINWADLKKTLDAAGIFPL